MYVLLIEGNIHAPCPDSARMAKPTPQLAIDDFPVAVHPSNEVHRTWSTCLIKDLLLLALRLLARGLQVELLYVVGWGIRLVA